jgi:hypothetical protein
MAATARNGRASAAQRSRRAARSRPARARLRGGRPAAVAGDGEGRHGRQQDEAQPAQRGPVGAGRAGQHALGAVQLGGQRLPGAGQQVDHPAERPGQPAVGPADHQEHRHRLAQGPGQPQEHGGPHAPPGLGQHGRPDDLGAGKPAGRGRLPGRVGHRGQGVDRHGHDRGQDHDGQDQAGGQQAVAPGHAGHLGHERPHVGHADQPEDDRGHHGQQLGARPERPAPPRGRHLVDGDGHRPAHRRGDGQGDRRHRRRPPDHRRGPEPLAGRVPDRGGQQPAPVERPGGGAGDQEGHDRDQRQGGRGGGRAEPRGQPREPGRPPGDRRRGQGRAPRSASDR